VAGLAPWLASALVAAICAAPAQAAQQPITGKLDKRGYTVVALSKSGAASAAAKKGSFKIVPAGGRATIQLRDAKGRYAGPVVMAVTKKGKSAILGVKAGTRLGKIKVLKGYAVLKKALKPKRLDKSQTARARSGKPLGAGNFGRVASRRARPAQDPGATPPPPAPAADPDSDGVPNAFDVDDNGNLVLDNADPSGGTTGFSVFSQIFLGIDETVNANAGGISDAAISSAVRDKLLLTFLSIADGTELDCGGLSYCSPGGSGEVFVPPEEGGNGGAFPESRDADGDGFGTISGGRTGPTGAEFILRPGATAGEIRAGDAMIELTPDAELPGSLNFVFNSVPALASYSDTGGNAETISYPVAANGPGTQSNPIPVTAGADDHVRLTINFWRPQRQPLPGEGSDFVDIGKLGYSLSAPNARPPGSAPGPPQCPPSSLSSSDPDLAPAPGGIGRLVDSAADAPAATDRQLTLTVDLTDCFQSKGGDLKAISPTHIELGAAVMSASSDHAEQSMWIRQTPGP
jgi:hypothetical protein